MADQEHHKPDVKAKSASKDAETRTDIYLEHMAEKIHETEYQTEEQPERIPPTVVKANPYYVGDTQPGLRPAQVEGRELAEEDSSAWGDDATGVPIVGGGATGGDVNAMGLPGSISGINVAENTEQLQREGHLGAGVSHQTRLRQTMNEFYNPELEPSPILEESSAEMSKKPENK